MLDMQAVSEVWRIKSCCLVWCDLNEEEGRGKGVRHD